MASPLPEIPLSALSNKSNASIHQNGSQTTRDYRSSTLKAAQRRRFTGFRNATSSSSSSSSVYDGSSVSSPRVQFRPLPLPEPPSIGNRGVLDVFQGYSDLAPKSSSSSSGATASATLHENLVSARNEENARNLRVLRPRSPSSELSSVFSDGHGGSSRRDNVVKKNKKQLALDKLKFKQMSSQIGDLISERNTKMDKYIGKDLKGDGMPLKSECSGGKYEFLRVFVASNALSLKLDFDTNSGRCEVFVSNSEMYSFVTDRSHHWRLTKGNGTLLITQQDGAWSSGCYYYISIYAVTNCIVSCKATVQSRRKEQKTKNTTSLAENLTTASMSVANWQPGVGTGNIQARIKERVLALKTNPVEMNDFRQRVDKIRKKMKREYAYKLNLTKQNSRDFQLINVLEAQIPYAEQTKLKQLRRQAHSARVKNVHARKRHNDELFKEAVYTKIMTRKQKHEAILKEKREKAYIAWVREYNMKWQGLIKVAAGMQIWRKKVEDHIYMQKLNKLKSWAIIKVQRWVRRHLARKAAERAERNVQSFRSCMLLFAFNLNIVKRDRAADALRWFLMKNVDSNVNPLSRVARNYIRKVKLIQRCIKRWKSQRVAKLELWQRQWNLITLQLIQDGKIHPNAKKIPEYIKRKTLKAQMEVEAKQSKRDFEGYKDRLANFLSDWRMESQRNKIMGVSGMDSKIKRPVVPHVPVTLPRQIITNMISKSVKDLMLDADDLPAGAANGSAGSPRKGRRGTRVMNNAKMTRFKK